MGPQPHDGHIEGLGKAKRMSRIRRYLVPALLLLPVIFICGKLLLVPLRTSKSIKLQDNTILNIGVPYAIPDTQQTGWPWVYREQVDVAGLPPFDPEFEANYFSCCALMADVAVARGDRCGRCHHPRVSSSSSWRLVAIFDPRTVGHDRHRGGGAVLVGERKKPLAREQHFQQLFSYLQPHLNTAGRVGCCTCAEDNLSTFDRVTSLQMPEADPTSVPIPPINC